MTVQLTRILEALLLPPGILFLLLAAGLLLIRTRPRWGYPLAVLGLVSLYLLSTPLVAHRLIGTLEDRWPALPPALTAPFPAHAIVLLAGGRKADAPEYGGDTVSHFSFTRLRYAAWLHRHTGLPIIASGGTVLSSSPFSEAELMARVLREEFGIREVIIEDGSRTTRENARNVRRLAEQRNLAPVYLVTHAFHMPRAVASFREAGLEVIPAPTAFTNIPAGDGRRRILDFLPHAAALQTSWVALHEYAGMLWYHLTDGDGSEPPPSRGS